MLNPNKTEEVKKFNEAKHSLYQFIHTKKIKIKRKKKFIIITEAVKKYIEKSKVGYEEERIKLEEEKGTHHRIVSVGNRVR